MTTEPAYDQDEEDAALWVARHMSNVVDATAFAEWLAGAPDRRAKFDALWATCMDDAVAGGARLYEQRAQARHAKKLVTRRRVAVGGFAAAASLALAVFAWPSLEYAATPAERHATAAGETRSVTLADGTRVTLNGATSIAARITGNRRDVTLEKGEALFDVEHDAKRPFSVAAGAGQVTVLGTRFDLALNGDQVDLAVERGLVRFESSDRSGAPVLVHAAQRSSLANGMVADPSSFDPAASANWVSGWLQVSDLQLKQMLPQLQRWTRLRIVVADPALLGKRVAGRFRLSDPAVVLDNLGVLYGFTVRRTADAYILEAR